MNGFERHLYDRLNDTAMNIYSQELGWVFYPCRNAIKEAIEKSMAWVILNFGYRVMTKN